MRWFRSLTTDGSLASLSFAVLAIMMPVAIFATVLSLGSSSRSRDEVVTAPARGLPASLSLTSHTEAAAKAVAEDDTEEPPFNVLFIISDDLTATALSCYGNEVSRTPNIDRLAEGGTLFTHAYCQFPICGPSRASFMTGYYPHATRVFGYSSGRRQIGDRATWTQHFMNHGYHAARVGKIYHLGVPRGVERGENGADDQRSWTERHNSQGPEWQAPGEGERLERNPNHDLPVCGGNVFNYVMADGGDLEHADGRTADTACRLLRERAESDQPFFLAVGFVRPHIPFVAPRQYFEAYPFDEMVLPEKREGDWDDIPRGGINYRTSSGMRMDEGQQRCAIGGYYASVAYVDAMVGQVIGTLEELNLSDNTIVIFTSDHGFHLGEHDFWAKVSVHEESAKVPLIIRVPGKETVVCESMVELIDLYPTLSQLCALPVPERIQGENIAEALDDGEFSVRDAAFTVTSSGRAFMLRNARWAYLQYREDASGGMELYDMQNDPEQYTNLANDPEYADVVADFQARLAAKLVEVRDNDLGN